MGTRFVWHTQIVPALRAAPLSSPQQAVGHPAGFFVKLVTVGMSRLAPSMTSVEVIQEVQVLPRATASHQPGSETRWREATHVRSRVEQGSRVGIEPRKLFASRGPARDNHPRGPDPWVWEARTVSVRWNAVSALPVTGEARRRPPGVVDPLMFDTGMTWELASSLIGLLSRNRGSARSRTLRGSPPRDQRSRRKGPRPRRVDPPPKHGDGGRPEGERDREGPLDGRVGSLSGV